MPMHGKLKVSCRIEEVHCIILQPKPSVTHSNERGAILACGTRKRESEYSLPLLMRSPRG